MDDRATHAAKAAAAARTQAANVNVVAKAACLAQAAQKKPKARAKAVKSCTRQYGAGIFAQGTGLGRTGQPALRIMRQMPMIGAGRGCSEHAGCGDYAVGKRSVCGCC